VKRWFPLLLAVSLGLNVGLLWGRWRSARPATPPAPPCPSGTPVPGSFLPGRPGWNRWTAAIRPEVMRRRRAVREARLALRDALARTEPDTLEIRRCLARLATAQHGLDSVVAFSLARRLRVLSPAERRRVLDALPWTRGIGPGGPPGPPGGRLPVRPRSP